MVDDGSSDNARIADESFKTAGEVSVVDSHKTNREKVCCAAGLRSATRRCLFSDATVDPDSELPSSAAIEQRVVTCLWVAAPPNLAASHSATGQGGRLYFIVRLARDCRFLTRMCFKAFRMANVVRF